MYCGKNRTACASQRQISDAMLSLMQIKPYSSISVSALCKEAGVSRQTFYSLFSSMDNVILYILREECCEIQPEQKHIGWNSTIDYLCCSYSAYITAHRDFLKLLVENNISYLLYNSIYDSCSECCCPDINGKQKGHIEKQERHMEVQNLHMKEQEGYMPEQNLYMKEQERLYAAHFLAGGITGIVRFYCMTEPPLSEQALSDQLKKLLTGRTFSN